MLTRDLFARANLLVNFNTLWLCVVIRGYMLHMYRKDVTTT